MRSFMQSKQEVLKQLGVEENFGLSHQQVAESKKRYGINAFLNDQSDSLIGRTWRVITEPMVIALVIVGLIAVGLNIMLGYMGREINLLKCIGIFVLISLFVILTVIIEGKKAKAFEAFSENNEEMNVRVIRSGEARLISHKEVVVGDVVCVVPGDKLPADGRLIESMSLRVDEVSLTGESTPKEKDADIVFDNENIPIARRSNMLYSGCCITSGYGRMVVTEVGRHTEFGKKVKELLAAERSATPLQDKLVRISRLITILGTTATAIVSII